MKLIQEPALEALSGAAPFARCAFLQISKSMTWLAFIHMQNTFFKIYFIELWFYIAIKKSLYFLCGTWICFRSQLLKHIQEPAPVVAQDPPMIEPESQLRHSIMESDVYILNRQNQPSAFINHQIWHFVPFYWSVDFNKVGSISICRKKCGITISCFWPLGSWINFRSRGLCEQYVSSISKSMNWLVCSHITFSCKTHFLK